MILKKLSLATAVAAFVAPTFALADSSTTSLQQQINQLQQEVNHLNMHHNKMHKKGLRAIPVTTTPLLARQSLYNATDIVSNFPGINEDLTLLQLREQDDAAMGPHKANKQRPWVQLSGYINAVGQYTDPQYFGATQHHTGLNITAAALDTTAYVSPWVSSFVELKWNSVDGNSYIQAKRAFITLGKLNSSPFYASLGTMYVPFGRYSTALIEDPLTKDMGRNLATHGALLLGYAKPNVSVQAFTFKGDAKVKGHADDIFGADANYYANYKNGKAQFGAGLMNNLSESINIQAYKYLGQLYGFNGHDMSKRVPAYDLNAQASFGAFVLTAEFIGTTTDYSTNDLSFNGLGAKPKAYHVEALYNFNLMNRPSNAGIYYGGTSQALGFALPKDSYGAIFNTEIAKDLLFAAEYQHNVDYSANATAGRNASTTFNLSGDGKSQNIFDLQVAAYF